MLLTSSTFSMAEGGDDYGDMPIAEDLPEIEETFTTNSTTRTFMQTPFGNVLTVTYVSLVRGLKRVLRLKMGGVTLLLFILYLLYSLAWNVNSHGIWEYQVLVKR